MTEDEGIIVEVPFIHRGETSQFHHVDDWFGTQSPPFNVKLLTPSGPNVMMFGVKWISHSVRLGVSMGRLAPSEVLFADRDAFFLNPLKVTEAVSHVDGLPEWLNTEMIDFDTQRKEDGTPDGLLVRIYEKKEQSWQQGTATLSVESDWHTEFPDGNYHSGLNISSWQVLVSRFPEPRPMADHLAEQKIVIHLVTLLSGEPIRFRRHRVSDKSIVRSKPMGNEQDYPRVDLITSQTVGDYAKPYPDERQLGDFVAYFRALGTDGMAKWSQEYDKWSRCILPSVGVLSRREAADEDVVMSTSLTMEAAGSLIGVRDGEAVTYNPRNQRPTTATNVYRCLHVLGLNYDEIAPDLSSVAYLIANTYNDIKHFDRQKYPTPQEAHVVASICRFVVRLLALHIIDDTGELLTEYREHGALRRIDNLRDTYGLRISNRGRFVTNASEQDPR
jgi:hypothetical protein